MTDDPKPSDYENKTMGESFADIATRLGNIEKTLVNVAMKTDLQDAVKKILDRLPPKP